MGASVSKSSTEIVNSTLVNAVIEAAQTTNAGLSSTQTNDIAGFSFLSVNKQTSSVSVQALQQVSIDANLLDKITQDVKNAAKAEGAMLNPAVANSDVKIKNVIQSKFTNSSLQNCVAFVSAEQTNRVRAGGVSIGVVNMQTSDILASCKVLQGISSAISRELFTDTSQSANSKSKGLLDSMLGNNSLMYIIIFVVFIVVAGLIYSIFNKPVNNGTQNNPNNFSNPNNNYSPTGNGNPSTYGNINNSYPNPVVQNTMDPTPNDPINFRSYDPNNPPVSENNNSAQTNPMNQNTMNPMNQNTMNPMNSAQTNPMNPMNYVNQNIMNRFRRNPTNQPNMRNNRRR